MTIQLPEFKRQLTTMVERKDLALPSTVSPDAFRNAALVAVQDNPHLRQCSPETVFRAIRQLAGMGLVPDNREAAIVPFKGQAMAQPMVYGLIKTARNSAQVSSLFAEVVYEGEELAVWIEDGERRFAHTKDGGHLDPLTRGGKVVGAYAVAKLRDGTIEFDAMGLEQIEKRRRASPNQKTDKPTGIWADWFEEMAKKTVIRALCKRLPMSSDDLTRIERDPTFRDEEPKDVTPKMTTAERLKAAAEREPEPVDGEILPDFIPGDVSDRTAEFDEGVTAYNAGKSEGDNPYKSNPEYTQWLGGFRQAHQALGTGEE